jgi:toxin-antitoxin system PIN domain toxin
VIAVDTNLLVYAHRRDAPLHDQGAAAIRQLAEGSDPWALPWPCVHEFLAIVTHPRIFSPPTELTRALAQVSAWLDSPTVELLHEGAGYWDRLASLLQQGKIVGPRVHDARIAALCLHHGVRELWSADRDFSRFPTLTVHNPLL